jgi:rhamnosyltransferase
MSTVDAVLVTYYPNQEMLISTIESIITQVRKLYIIDNTSSRDISLKNFHYDNLEIVYLDENMGIAYAQNVGIRQALANEADYVLLSDQDTCYPTNYINHMLLPHIDSDLSIAVIAPRFNDITSCSTEGVFYSESSWLYSKFHPKKGIHPLFQTIASGMIIRTSTLKDIGLMNERLFIDWVDFEWCWRARKKGYIIMGNADVIITHQLGESSVNIGVRKINLRTPIRHYYITRNAFFLALHTTSLNKIQRLVLFLKSFRYLIGYPLFSKPHLTHLKYVLLGFWHGIIGKLGKFS